MLSRRNKILDDNRGMREGRLDAPTRLEEGYAAFRIPTEDWQPLLRSFPELESKDHVIRLKAWHKLRASPLGEKYLVTRTPRQVKADDSRIIIK